MRVSRGVDDKRGAVLLCLVALLALACRRAEPPPRPARTRPSPATPDVHIVSPVGASTAPDAGGAAALSLAPTAPADPSAAVTGPLDVVAAPDGAVVVYVVSMGGRRADIVARRVDVDGRWSGAPRRLRATTGPVTALDADLYQGRLWVAWIANPGGDPAVDGVNGEQLVVALTADATLANASRPVTLMDYRARPVGRPWERPAVEVRGTALGAVAVSTGPSQTCVHEAGTDHASREPCPGWTTHTIRVDGAHESETEGLLAASQPPWGLTRTTTGVVGLVADDHVATKTHLRAIAGMPSAGEGTYLHAVNARLAFDGARLLMVASDEGGGDGPQRTRALGWGEGLRASQGDGSWESLPPVTAHSLRCVEGRPVVRYAWGGNTVELDPAAPGACFELAAHLPEGALPERYPALAWAGRAVVGVDPEHGTLHRWRCEGRGLRELP